MDQEVRWVTERPNEEKRAIVERILRNSFGPEWESELMWRLTFSNDGEMDITSPTQLVDEIMRAFDNGKNLVVECVNRKTNIQLLCYGDDGSAGVPASPEVPTPPLSGVDRAPLPHPA